MSETTRRQEADARPSSDSTRERMHHAGLVVADLDRSVAFYRDLLGLTLLEQGRESGPVYAEMFGVESATFRWAELDLGGGHVLELICYEPVAADDRARLVTPEQAVPQSALSPSVGNALPPVCAHLALRVTDASDMCHALVESGAPVLSRPVSLQEDNHWHGARVFYARDPDGYLLELVQEARP